MERSTLKICEKCKKEIGFYDAHYDNEESKHYFHYHCLHDYIDNFKLIKQM